MVNSTVEYVMNLLKATHPGVEVVIAGGAARDTYLGKKCRDYDVFVHLGRSDKLSAREVLGYRGLIDTSDRMYGTAHEHAEDLSIGLRNSGFDCNIIFSYGTSQNPVFGDFDERHYSVVKASRLSLLGERTEIDIIFTKSKDLGETLLSFDCNLNMCYLDSNYEPKYPMGEPTVLQFTGRPLHPNRIGKMLVFARDKFGVMLTPLQEKVALGWYNESDLEHVIKETVIFKDC